MFVANVVLIIGFTVLAPTRRALVVAFVIAALYPVMAEIGKRLSAGEDEVQTTSDTTMMGSYRKFGTAKEMANKNDSVDELYLFDDSSEAIIAEGCLGLIKENSLYEEGMNDMSAVDALDETRFTPLHVYARYLSNFVFQFASIGSDSSSY